jgi:hypothetical protein
LGRPDHLGRRQREHGHQDPGLEQFQLLALQTVAGTYLGHLLEELRAHDAVQGPPVGEHHGHGQLHDDLWVHDDLHRQAVRLVETLGHRGRRGGDLRVRRVHGAEEVAGRSRAALDLPQDALAVAQGFCGQRWLGHDDQRRGERDQDSPPPGQAADPV